MASVMLKLRRHVEEYKFFYATATLALLPVWTHLKLLTVNLSNSNIDMLYQVRTLNYLPNLAVLLFIISVGLKRKTPVLKRIGKLLFIFAIFMQTVFVVLALQSGLYNLFFSIFFAGSLAISALWIIIYLLSDDTGFKIGYLTKNGVVFLVIMYIFLYLPKYFSDKTLSSYLIRATLESDMIELEKIISDSICWTSISTAGLLFLFFLVYISFRDKFFSTKANK